MPNKLHIGWRSNSIFILFMAMLLSLFISRAALSVCIFLFVVVSFSHARIKEQLLSFISTPLLWSMSLLFLVPLLSGTWSKDTEKWLEVIRIKLPLLLLPLAFAGPFNFSKKMWNVLAYIFIIIIIGGTCWSMFQYINNINAVNDGYLKAKTIVTPLLNDHIRFSWMVSVAALLAAWLFYKEENKTARIVLAFATVWLVIFLHILAARTGLLSFYIMLMATTVWFILKKAKTKQGVILLLVLIAIPVAAWFTLPTLQNRVKYMQYDFGYFKEAHYLPGANDAVRVISLIAAWNIMNAQPLNGTGFGDLLTETNKWYAATYPAMIEQDKIYPSSEWLLYGAACGWPGIIIFTFVMLLPFFISINNKLLWWMLNGTAAFSFLFDIGLEVQFGVFIYSFIVLWWWKWMNAEKM